MRVAGEMSPQSNGWVSCALGQASGRFPLQSILNARGPRRCTVKCDRRDPWCLLHPCACRSGPVASSSSPPIGSSGVPGSPCGGRPPGDGARLDAGPGSAPKNAKVRGHDAEVGEVLVEFRGLPTTDAWTRLARAMDTIATKLVGRRGAQRMRSRSFDTEAVLGFLRASPRSSTPSRTTSCTPSTRYRTTRASRSCRPSGIRRRSGRHALSKRGTCRRDRRRSPLVSWTPVSTIPIHLVPDVVGAHTFLRDPRRGRHQLRGWHAWLQRHCQQLQSDGRPDHGTQWRAQSGSRP